LYYLVRAIMRGLLLGFILLVGCTSKEHYPLILRNGLIYDGSGNVPFKGDVAIRGDSIAAIGELNAVGEKEIDVQGLAIAPGLSIC
jgi:N-acyl-D-amino-acid deacylase